MDYLLEHSTHLGGEHTVDDGIGGRVQWGEALDECGDRQIRLRSWNAAKHLQQVEHNVGRPAQDKHCEHNKRAVNKKKKKNAE